MNLPDATEPRAAPDAVEDDRERGRGDPESGEGTAPACLNCGAPLSGPYCARCGQKDVREIPAVWKMIADLVGDVFELDSRIWRTLRPFVVRPGSLTVQYLAGRRARYLPPLRLFTATGIIMLLVYSLSGDSPLQVDGDMDGSGEEDPAVEAVDDAGDAAASAAADESDLSERFSEAVLTRMSQDPEEIQEAFGENLPRMMFIFLPLAAGMLMLLHLGSGRRYVEHLVFSLYVHAFVLMLALTEIMTVFLVA